MVDEVGWFRPAESRARFLQAFEAATSRWPDRSDEYVETAYGTTAMSRTHGRGAAFKLVLLSGGR